MSQVPALPDADCALRRALLPWMLLVVSAWLLLELIPLQSIAQRQGLVAACIGLGYPLVHTTSSPHAAHRLVACCWMLLAGLPGMLLGLRLDHPLGLATLVGLCSTQAAGLVSRMGSSLLDMPMSCLVMMAACAFGEWLHDCLQAAPPRISRSSRWRRRITANVAMAAGMAFGHALALQLGGGLPGSWLIVNLLLWMAVGMAFGLLLTEWSFRVEWPE